MTKIWGHRGCRGPNNPPENSLAAFEAAIAQGADGVEFDVYATADGQLVVFHDTSVEKLTNGNGKVSSLDYAAIKELKLRKNGSEELSDQSIPSIDAALDLIKEKAKPDFVVNIEIKGPGIGAQVAAALRKRIMQNWKRDQFLVTAFDLNTLRDFNKALPAIPIGILLAGPSPTWNFSENMLAKKLPEVADLHPTTINLTLPSMTPRAIDMITKSGAKPVAWTSQELPPAQLAAADRAHLLSYLSQGHVLVTDYPAEIRALLGGAAKAASA